MRLNVKVPAWKGNCEGFILSIIDELMSDKVYDIIVISEFHILFPPSPVFFSDVIVSNIGFLDMIEREADEVMYN